MTWTQFCSGLRAVRDHGQAEEFTTDRALVELGYAVGDNRDPCGLVLTEQGEAMVRRIDRDTPIQLAELTQVARAMDRRG